MPAGNLNVIFHGLFAFVVHHECIEVLIPKVDGHHYRAGEVELAAQASYQLRGVESSDSVTRFSIERFPVVAGFTVIDRTPARLQNSIYLPFPETFAGLREITVGHDGYFGGRVRSQITCKHIPLVYVLRYGYKDPAHITLDSIHVPAPAEGGDVNLHIYAEPPAPAAEAAHGLPRNHAVLAFQKLVRLFPGLELELRKHDSIAPGPLPKIGGIDADADQRSLMERGVPGGALPALPNPPRPICISLVVDNA